MTIKRLDKRDGFAYNLSLPRPDRLAREAVEHVFGIERVNSVCESLHRAEMSYEALMDDFMQYDRTFAKSCRDDPIYQMAYQSIRDQLQTKSKIVPLTTGAVPNLPDFPRQKSAGLPWKLQGVKSKQDAIDAGALDSNRRLWHSISYGVACELPDVCLFSRAQVCKTDVNKIRATWGYPLDVYLEEARFFYPLLNYVSSPDCKLPIAYGFEMANGAMDEIYRQAVKYQQYFMTDWKTFDKTIPPWLIRDAFSLLAEIVDFTRVQDSEGKIWNVREARSKIRWKKLIDYFVQTPVRTCRGERFLVTGGVPSGSCFTNLIDTIINCLVTRYISYSTTNEFPKFEMYLGDDAVLMYSANVKLNIDDWVSLASDMFSMVLNKEKIILTTNHRNIYFLGYYCFDGLPFKPQDTLIASFVFPERTRRTHVEAGAAALGQLYSCMDPYYAYAWYKVIEYINQRYPLTPEDILKELQMNAHRHKYLRLIGINAFGIRWPEPDDHFMIMCVLPKSLIKKKFKMKAWNYDAIWDRAQDFWLLPETTPDDDNAM